MDMETRMITCTAPVNIAVVKYWGKRDEKLILPINDSISVTLSSDQMHAKTTVTARPHFTEDKIWLNGQLEESTSRLASCLAEVRERARQERTGDGPHPDWKVRICSVNNFPTAAGLASSAAGYACLVSALCKLYGIQGDISALARRGSGSACRSVYGGFVQWKMGELADGSDSIAVQLNPASHWPDLRVIICVASDSRKKTSSSVGMRNSVNTSELLSYRAQHCVPTRIQRMQTAINAQDFATFAKETIVDSNQFHAICQDTMPPCVYLNQVSHAVSSLVHQVNSFMNEIVAGYTFDAGPNACIFLPSQHVGLFCNLLRHFFAADDNQEFQRGEPVQSVQPSEELVSKLNIEKVPGGLKYLICTRAGEGPKELGPEHHLLNDVCEPKSD